jgi:Flp pilus assembly CpaF family ATPase
MTVNVQQLLTRHFNTPHSGGTATVQSRSEMNNITLMLSRMGATFHTKELRRKRGATHYIITLQDVPIV